MREAQANFRWLDGFVELSLDSREDYSVIYALFYDKKSASKAIHKMNGRVYDPEVPDRVLHVQFGYREMTPSTHGKRRLDEIAAAQLQQAKRPRYEAGNPVPVSYPNPSAMVLPQMAAASPASLPSTYSSLLYPAHSPSAQTHASHAHASIAAANPPLGDLSKRPARPPRNEPCTTLFMPFVPQGVDEDVLRQVFEAQPGLIEVRFRTPKQRHFNLICFAEFDTIPNAIKARENLDGYMVEACLYSDVPKLRNGLVCDFATTKRFFDTDGACRVVYIGSKNNSSRQHDNDMGMPMGPNNLPMLPVATGFQPSAPTAGGLGPTAAVVITADDQEKLKQEHGAPPPQMTFAGIA